MLGEKIISSCILESYRIQPAHLLLPDFLAGWWDSWRGVALPSAVSVPRVPLLCLCDVYELQLISRLFFYQWNRWSRGKNNWKGKSWESTVVSYCLLMSKSGILDPNIWGGGKYFSWSLGHCLSPGDWKGAETAIEGYMAVSISWRTGCLMNSHQIKAGKGGREKEGDSASGRPSARSGITTASFAVLLCKVSTFPGCSGERRP